MSFSFTNPSIHGVKNITARTTLCNQGYTNEFCCLTLIFYGDEGEPKTIEAYFPKAHINKAISLDAAINVLTQQEIEDNAT